MAAFLRQSRAEMIQNILAGVHATARIAQQKFRWVSISVASLLATLVLWTALDVLRMALPLRVPQRSTRTLGRRLHERHKGIRPDASLVALDCVLLQPRPHEAVTNRPHDLVE
jgi:hypothetical protein